MHRPVHQPSLPVFPSYNLPLEISVLPASTRTSFTRVDEELHAQVPLSGADYTVPRPRSLLHTPDGDNDEADAAEECLDAHDESGDERAEEAVLQPPQTVLTFLLVSGRRRTMSFDPETTVGRVKELVWNTWPNGACLLSCPPHPHCTRAPREARSASVGGRGRMLLVQSPYIDAPACGREQWEGVPDAG